MDILETYSCSTVVSTFASPHKPTLKPKTCKRASASPARITAFEGGFRIASLKKTKKLVYDEQVEWVFQCLLNTLITFIKLKKRFE